MHEPFPSGCTAVFCTRCDKITPCTHLIVDGFWEYICIDCNTLAYVEFTDQDCENETLYMSSLSRNP